MSKKQEVQENKGLLEMALSATRKNITKSGSGGSGRVTYLDRFVNALLDADGNPTQPKSKTQVIAMISLDICKEMRADEIESGDADAEFNLTAEGDTPDDELFAATNKKVKNQVNSHVANNKNSTSVSYNPKYKDVWSVVKEGGMLSLQTKADADAEAIANQSEEDAE